jgi:hypothetical protein
MCARTKRNGMEWNGMTWWAVKRVVRVLRVTEAVVSKASSGLGRDGQIGGGGKAGVLM